jgi:hypothetical protein
MDDVFDDERLQFFLRNRDDIKAWAALEPELVAATRDLLAQALPLIANGVASIDPLAVVGRHDAGAWERIIVRHSSWPAAVGFVLEWHRTVDPLGAYPPKLGVFFWADPSHLIASRDRFLAGVSGLGLERLGYKVPLEGVWPVGAFVAGPADWWSSPTSWIASIVDRLAATWPIVAPVLDAVLPQDESPRDERGLNRG